MLLPLVDILAGIVNISNSDLFSSVLSAKCVLQSTRKTVSNAHQLIPPTPPFKSMFCYGKPKK